MLKVVTFPNSDGRKIIYTDEGMPYNKANGYDILPGDKLIIVGPDPKEYLWNGSEWVSPVSNTEMIYNGTGGDLSIGDLVYRNGWVDGYFSVAKANNETQAELVITETIANLGTGSASTTLELAGDTSAGFVGDPVYLSVTPGGWTLTAPTSGIVQTIGRVAVADATGTISLKLPGIINKVGTSQLQDGSVTLAKIQKGTVVSLYDLGAPIATDDDRIVESEAMDNKTYTIAAQPDVPRNLTIERTVVGDPDTPGKITIVGTNYNDEVISEEFIPGDNGVSVPGVKAFKTVTSVTGSEWEIGGTDADTIIIGVGNDLGVPRPTLGAEILLGVLGTSIVIPDVVEAATVEGSMVDMSTETYNGSKSAMIFQKN